MPTDAPKPSISVIIPVHNAAEYLTRGLAALGKSSLPPLECIVVDDQSEDGSAEIARSYGVRVIRTESCSGGYAARNLGASQAQGDILFFTDSDVCVQPDTLLRVQNSFQEDSTLDALIGSYDDSPGAPDLLSQYRNLLHHFVHQHGRRQASIFWTGCGAVRRDVFVQMDGFVSEQRFLGDIAFGYRLAQAGRKIVLDRTLTVKHLKRWRLGDMLRTDIFRRGATWTELILRQGGMPNDLNTRMGQRWSVVIVFLGLAGLALGLALRPPAVWWLPLAGLAVVYFLLNREFLAFLWRKRGLAFTLRALPLYLVYHLCCGLGLLLGVLRHLRRRYASV